MARKKKQKREMPDHHVGYPDRPLFNLCVALRQMVQPYWEPYPGGLRGRLRDWGDEHLKAETRARLADRLGITEWEGADRQPGDEDVAEEATASEEVVHAANAAEDAAVRSKIRISNVTKPITEKMLPSVGMGRILSYYDPGGMLEVVGHFAPEDGFRYSERSDSERKKLKPSLRPRTKEGEYDRAHLIPFGYHGSENDKRLLVGWDKVQNERDFNQFEQEVKALRYPIYWVTIVRRDGDGATWSYRIYNATNPKKPVLTKKLDRKSVHKFMWSTN